MTADLTDAALLAAIDAADPVPAAVLDAARVAFNPFAALAEPSGGLLIQHPIFPGASSTTAVLETSGPDDETCHIPCCADDDLDSTRAGACWTACPKRQGARP